MKQKSTKKNIIAMVSLALTLILNVSFLQPVKAFAASKTLAYVQSREATAFNPVSFPVQVTSTSDVEINVYVASPAGVTISVSDRNGNLCGNSLHLTNYDSSWVLDGKGWYTSKYTMNQLETGSYTVEYTFDQDVTFDAKIVQLSAGVSFAGSKITLTQGFSQKLKINNAKAKSFSSSNKKVATVDKKGKVTGKKAGSAVITAKLTNGKKIKCKVTVKSNTYSADKLTSSSVGINEYAAAAYSASYKSNGNLVIKFRVVNETDHKLSSIPKFSVTITNQENNGVASYQKSSFKVDVPAHSYKDYTITIKKGALSGKKADLRNSIIKIEGERVDL